MFYGRRLPDGRDFPRSLFAGGDAGTGQADRLYDHNGISIDGETKGWFTDDTAKRFEAYHWHVVHEIDGHDPEAVKKAILEAQSVTDKPSLIICRTVIGFGSPNKAGKEEAHGAALGEEEVALTRQKLGWHHPAFHIPKEIYRARTREKTAKSPAGLEYDLLRVPASIS